jgi:DNA ligase (NAD+)
MIENNIEIKQRMEELIKKINKASYSYYVLDNPIISDKEWDKMYYELLDLEKETGIILPNSPSQKVGGDVLDGFKKVTHERKLMSLGKAQTIEEILDWDTRNQNIFFRPHPTHRFLPLLKGPPAADGNCEHRISLPALYIFLH